MATMHNLIRLRRQCVNVLDISSADSREHFLLSNILAFIERSGGAAKGFVQARNVFEFAQQLGLTQARYISHIDRAVDKRLLERSSRYTSEFRDCRLPDDYSWSVHNIQVVEMFVYLDAVCG